MRFRKKPVEIEAHQLTHLTAQAITQWLDHQQAAFMLHGDEFTGHGYLEIHTLEGTMRADYGDWIIQGVQGEFYPCKPDIFTQTYDPIND